MPVATIPGMHGRATTVEVFEPAQTQDDAAILIDRFELGPNEIREGYVTPSPYTSFRYREESIDQIDQSKQAKDAKSSEQPKLLPHMQAEGEAGQKRVGEITPAMEAVDEARRAEGVELPAERAQRWQDDVEKVKGGQLSIEESSREVLKGRVNRTQDDMVPVGEDDYESTGSSGSSAGQSAGQSKKAQAKEDKAAEARRKAQERREQQNQ